jgi:hypothetical protein
MTLYCQREYEETRTFPQKKSESGSISFVQSCDFVFSEDPTLRKFAEMQIELKTIFAIMQMGLNVLVLSQIILKLHRYI